MRNFTKLLTLFVLCLIGYQVKAQNVTVRPSTGSMIAAVKDGGQTDTYFRRNGFATWRHNQLCLTMTTSDGKTKTPNGQLANPANDIYGDVNANELQVAKGALGMTCYLNFALPKGYRFTGSKSYSPGTRATLVRMALGTRPTPLAPPILVRLMRTSISRLVALKESPTTQMPRWNRVPRPFLMRITKV